MAAMASYNPKVAASRDVDDDDFDFAYFAGTYKPLSNLPTPPPSSRNSVTSSPVLGEWDENVDPDLLGTFGLFVWGGGYSLLLLLVNSSPPIFTCTY